MVYLEMRSGIAWKSTHQGVQPRPWSRPYALCLRCLAWWFPDWNPDRVEEWLDRQKAEAARWEREKELRKELRKENDDRHLAAWLAGVVKD